MNQIQLKRKEKAYMIAISEIIATKVKNVNINDVTITNVHLSNDGSYLKVIVVFDKNETRSLQFLKNAEPFVRKCLAQIDHQRRVPKISFEIDTAYKNALKIESILNNLNLDKGEPQK